MFVFLCRGWGYAPEKLEFLGKMISAYFFLLVWNIMIGTLSMGAKEPVEDNFIFLKFTFVVCKWSLAMYVY